MPDGLRFEPAAEVEADDTALGRLMELAYAGTIDQQLGDNTDGTVEIASWRATVADPACSRIARTVDGELVAACLVGRWEDVAFIAYVMTLPTWKQRGVARALVAGSLDALHDVGDEHVVATITEGNVPSERLFAQLGFRRHDPGP